MKKKATTLGVVRSAPRKESLGPGERAVEPHPSLCSRRWASCLLPAAVLLVSLVRFLFGAWFCSSSAAVFFSRVLQRLSLGPESLPADTATPSWIGMWRSPFQEIQGQSKKLRISSWHPKRRERRGMLDGGMTKKGMIGGAFLKIALESGCYLPNRSSSGGTQRNEWGSSDVDMVRIFLHVGSHRFDPPPIAPCHVFTKAQIGDRDPFPQVVSFWFPAKTIQKGTQIPILRHTQLQIVTLRCHESLVVGIRASSSHR